MNNYKIVDVSALLNWIAGGIPTAGASPYFTNTWNVLDFDNAGAGNVGVVLPIGSVKVPSVPPLFEYLNNLEIFSALYDKAFVIATPPTFAKTLSLGTNHLQASQLVSYDSNPWAQQGPFQGLVNNAFNGQFALPTTLVNTSATPTTNQTLRLYYMFSIPISVPGFVLDGVSNLPGTTSSIFYKDLVWISSTEFYFQGGGVYLP